MGDDRHVSGLLGKTAGHHVYFVAPAEQLPGKPPTPSFQSAAGRIELLQYQADSHGSVPDLRCMTCCLANTSRISRLSAGQSFATPK